MRPLLPAAVAGSATLLLSACTTFTNADAVARVGDSDIDEDRFAALAAEYYDQGDVFGTTAAENGRGDADQGRGLLSALVRQQAFIDFVTERDPDLDLDALRTEIVATVGEGDPLFDLSEEFQTLIIDVNSDLVPQALAGVPAPASDRLEAMYAANPAATGLVCVRHILVATEAEALGIVDELADGADFATIAVERSLDPTAAGAGGAITDGAGECVALQTMQQGFVPEFVAAALDGAVGVPTPPVETSFGWHVILHRPWDEVASTVELRHQPGQSGRLLFDGYLATVDVDVDPRYGRWEPSSLSIVALG